MATFAWNDGSGQVITITPISGNSNSVITVSTPQTFIPETRSIQLKASLNNYDRYATINITQSPIGIGNMKIGNTFIVYGNSAAKIASLNSSNNTTKISTLNKVKTWLKKLVQ